MRYRVSAPESALGSVLSALALAFPGASLAQGADYCTVETDAHEDAVRSAALDAGADHVGAEGGPSSEGVEDVDGFDDSDSVPLAEEPVEVKAPIAGSPFCARFPTSDAKDAFIRAVAGRVLFSEPPTSRTADEFCVHGTGDAADVASRALECGGTTAPVVEAAEKAPDEAPPFTSGKYRGLGRRG